MKDKVIKVQIGDWLCRFVGVSFSKNTAVNIKTHKVATLRLAAHYIDGKYSHTMAAITGEEFEIVKFPEKHMHLPVLCTQRIELDRIRAGLPPTCGEH